MKIAICIGQYDLGGVGTSTSILASWLRKGGHQADIVATHFRHGPDYQRARRDGWPVKAICAGERWLRKRLEITRNHLSSYDVVVDNHSLETRLVFPALPAGAIRLSVIRSTNDPVILETAAYSSFVDALVGISPEVTQLLKKVNVSCRTQLIPNAVMVEAEAQPNIQTPIEMVYLGRLSNTDKNIFMLPAIALAVRSMGIPFTLEVMGDGRDRSKLEAMVRKYDLTDCVRCVGAIPHNSVGSVLSKKHFAIAPSNYEGFGLSLVESMAVGCVPIASDIPSYRWILGEDADRLVGPVKDAAGYARRIQTMASNPKLYRHIQDRLRDRQRRFFSPAIMVNNYLNLIDELSATRDPNRFSPVSLSNVPLSSYHRRRCSRMWWCLQKMKYG